MKVKLTEIFLSLLILSHVNIFHCLFDRLLDGFLDNTLLEALLNIKLQTVQIFATAQQSAEGSGKFS